MAKKADGYGAPNLVSDQNDGMENVARVVRSCYFPAAAAAGDLVSVDVSDTTYGLGASFKTTPAAADSDVVGVAESAVAAGEFGDVVIWGPVDTKADAGVGAGDLLHAGAVAGTADTSVAAVDRIIGFALEASAAGTAVCFIGAM